ncbi:hypothetical protein WH96_12430 [Kiloniella spongiae]|uniref:Uncharacterized protein n=1 Tax=Kiloniella spongiae TaxID=1489064 RepID=A0A0H2MUZ8_9PROT|nr:DUF2161 family putative PD-(D/E)XK-type phosphodiesterase [Kiloniella spongiae]KLN60510.1 hypothetical protein WH96_12430 [Kiloniella spongiae]
MRETELYPPVKAYLENQGYEVKSEIKGCDVIAVRGNETPVIVELKTGFNLTLLFQGIDRQALSDDVYIAFAIPHKLKRSNPWFRQQKDIIKLCRRLGLGLITVRMGDNKPTDIQVHADPGPYQPRKNKRRQGLLLQEFERRVGDPNEGGTNKRPIITAYRQDALRCANYLHRHQKAKVANIRKSTQVEKTAAILQRDVYGWFIRVDRGIYELSPKGHEAIKEYADIIKSLNAQESKTEGISPIKQLG